MANLIESTADAVLDDTSEANFAALQRLDVALTAAGVYRNLINTGEEDGAVTAILILNGLGQVMNDSAAASPLPVPDAARAFESLLRVKGIEAAVSMTDMLEPDAAIRIVLRRAHDAAALADLILGNLLEPYAAAHRLRTAMAAAGIKAPNIRAHGDAISIGHVAAEEALTLGEVLLGDSWPEELDLDSWADLEKLAEGLSQVLAAVTGAGVLVESDPCCSRCRGVHEVTIGRINDQQAHRLADAVAAAGCQTLTESASEYAEC